MASGMKGSIKNIFISADSRRAGALTFLVDIVYIGKATSIQELVNWGVWDPM